jgi:hypothetical protein
VLAPSKGEQRLNGIAISWGGCDFPDTGYADRSCESKMLIDKRGTAASDSIGEVASPKLWCVRLLHWMRQSECINLHAGFENFPHDRIRLKVTTI